jgi:hypothetical protein
MHYVTQRSPRMQIHKFGITCPGAIFMETTPGPPDDEKYCVDVSCLGHTEMHSVTHRSHRIQRQKFDITCPGVLLVESVPVPYEHEK